MDHPGDHTSLPGRETASQGNAITNEFKFPACVTIGRDAPRDKCLLARSVLIVGLLDERLEVKAPGRVTVLMSEW
jgi:hypothetical protein